MERDEKIAFWFLTKLLSDNISPDSINLLNRSQRDRTMMLAFQVYEYFNEKKLIPKPILDFMKSNDVSSKELKKYSNIMVNEEENNLSNASELGMATIKLLLNEIDIINSNQLQVEEPLISESQLKRLNKFLKQK